MAIKKYQAHINELGIKLGCEIVQKKDMAGMMYVEYQPPKIEGPIIKLQKDYLVMLHELGHVHHGHTQGRPPHNKETYYFDHGVLRSEAEAWEYALDNCMDELLPDSRKFMWNRCLNSYYSHAKALRGRPTRLGNGNRHYVEFVFDTPDDFFFDIKDRILNDPPVLELR